MVRIDVEQYQPLPGQPHSQDVLRAGEAKQRDWALFYDLCPIADGVLLEDVALTGGGTTSVAHGLGRPYRGYIRVRSTVADDYPSDVTSDDKGTYLKLDCTNTQTVSLWVF